MHLRVDQNQHLFGRACTLRVPEKINKKLSYRLETGRQLCIFCSSVIFYHCNYQNLHPSRRKPTTDEPADLLGPTYTVNKLYVRQGAYATAARALTRDITVV